MEGSANIQTLARFSIAAMILTHVLARIPDANIHSCGVLAPRLPGQIVTPDAQLLRILPSIQREQTDNLIVMQSHQRAWILLLEQMPDMAGQFFIKSQGFFDGACLCVLTRSLDISELDQSHDMGL